MKVVGVSNYLMKLYDLLNFIIDVLGHIN